VSQAGRCLCHARLLDVFSPLHNFCVESRQVGPAARTGPDGNLPSALPTRQVYESPTVTYVGHVRPVDWAMLLCVEADPCVRIAQGAILVVFLLLERRLPCFSPFTHLILKSVHLLKVLVHQFL
jgi:hypothetical protein